MRKSDKYRFSLQWGAETAEKIRAGDFLESLVNRKSELVVVAMNEYMDSHPEMLTKDQKPQIVIKPTITREQMKTMVLALIEEKLTGISLKANEADVTEHNSMVSEIDIDEMLKNLDLF